MAERRHTCKSSYTVTFRAPPALRVCSGAGSVVRRAAAEVASTSLMEQFQRITAAVGQTGPAAGRKAVGRFVELEGASNESQAADDCETNTNSSSTDGIEI